MNRDECYDQLLSVRDSITLAIREYQATACLSDGVCERFKKEALALLSDWDRAEANTAKYMQDARPLPPPLDGWPLGQGEDP